MEYTKKIQTRLVKIIISFGRTGTRWLVPVFSHYPLRHIDTQGKYQAIKVSFLGWQAVFAIRLLHTWRLAIGFAVQDIAPDDRVYQLFVRSYVQSGTEPAMQHILEQTQ